MIGRLGGQILVTRLSPFWDPGRPSGLLVGLGAGRVDRQQRVKIAMLNADRLLHDGEHLLVGPIG